MPVFRVSVLLLIVNFVIRHILRETVDLRGDSQVDLQTALTPGGEGYSPYIGYTGMHSSKGYGFAAGHK